MKKYLSLFLFIVLLFSIVLLKHSALVELPVEKTSLLLSEGAEVCPVYIPVGEVEYDSEWTGELPAIDKSLKEYKTATFGLG